MKNLKLRTKLSLLQVSAILMVVLGMLFAAVLLSQAPDFVAKCLEQKAGAAIDPVQIKEEVNAYIFHRAAPFLAVSAVYEAIALEKDGEVTSEQRWDLLVGLLRTYRERGMDRKLGIAHQAALDRIGGLFSFEDSE